MELTSNEYFNAHNYLGDALKNKKLYNEAIEEYKKALTFTPTNSNAYLNIALCYVYLGNKDLAKEFTEKAIFLDPLIKDTIAKTPELKDLI